MPRIRYFSRPIAPTTTTTTSDSNSSDDSSDPNMSSSDTNETSDSSDLITGDDADAFDMTYYEVTPVGAFVEIESQT